MTITQSNQLTLDYSYRGQPFVRGGVADLTTLDNSYRGQPYVSDTGTVTSTGTAAMTFPSMTTSSTGTVTNPIPPLDLPHKTPGVPDRVIRIQPPSPWKARSDFEDSEKKKRLRQIEVEKSHAEVVARKEKAQADADAVIASEKAAHEARVQELVDALFAPQPKVLTPEERARLAEEAKALKIRTDQLLREHEMEQQFLAQRIERDTKRREEQRRADIIANVERLRQEMEFEQEKRRVLEADDQAIITLIQQMELAEG